ncbi:MAG TPA: DUF4838 domain-containing protein [Candidatus Binataceae bacterium]|nr:DUF4838 domain-containing protein [Candidatus Binataceae bacterium]
MARSAKSTNKSGTSELTVFHPTVAGEPLIFAARELADSLAIMLEETVCVAGDPTLPPRRLRLAPAPRLSAAQAPGVDPPHLPAPGRDGFALWREAVPAGTPDSASWHGALVLAGGTERAVLHAAYDLLERLGARFPVGGTPRLAHCDRAGLDNVEAGAVAPAFGRRAFVSDIMTWHYETPERLARHLEHDHAFIPWMGARGLNAFSYIRHTVDSRLKIDQLVPLYRERGIASEYGGHVLQSLLPRERFDRQPELFPIGHEGLRIPRGNLCVSNPEALAIVSDGALRYVRDDPECALLHIWGADVKKGAWCRCGECAAMSPQLQYMRAVNAIADTIAERLPDGPPVTYLAYHDTLEPDPGLRPHPSVSFEWAPRERCYSHAIDDAACEVNPRYLESLKRYLELFDGRGHIFEYYADAILFGGLACATPAVISSDLRAYKAMGLDSISCLTFGAHSVLAYPVNLEAFARGTRSFAFDPDRLLADTVAALHPACASAMADAYRAIADASALILNGGGEVMRPRLPPPAQRLRDLKIAHDSVTRAVAAADHLVAAADRAFAIPERDIWHYGREVVSGITDYVAVLGENGAERRAGADTAIARIGAALAELRASAPAKGDTWASWDLEWISGIWLSALRRRFGEAAATDREKQ